MNRTSMGVGMVFGVAFAIAAGCGGQSFVGVLTDASADGPEPDGGSDAAKSDGSKDGATDAGVDACVPPSGSCGGGCPHGTVCVRESQAATTKELGCAPIPAACGAQASCDCMGTCVCPQGETHTVCTTESDGLLCGTQTISRAAYKKDIRYVSERERAELAHDALAIPLARYRYRSEGDGAREHLGFIIDDQPKNSPAVHPDGTHVDEYGYASMLLATVQEQQRQIEELEERLEAVERERACGAR